MRVLGIETSTDILSIGLLEDEKILSEIAVRAGGNCSEVFIPCLNFVLKEAGLSIEEIDGFAVSIGPGSFTGLRIGLSYVKGLSWRYSKPVVAVSSLDALALSSRGNSGYVCPMLDAKKKEIYVALYEYKEGEPLLRVKPRVLSPEIFLEELKFSYASEESVVFIGNGVKEYCTLIENILGKRALIHYPILEGPMASCVAYLGWRKLIKGEKEDLYTLEPIYIRPSEAELVHVKEKDILKCKLQNEK